jgi:hypothetical protein
MTIRIIGLGLGALLLAACGLSVDGLGPNPVDDAGSRTLEPVDGSVGNTPRSPAPAAPTADAAGASIDAREEPVVPGAANDASRAPIEAGSTCVLPAGATLCCGSVACANGDGTCATAGVCSLCQSTCTDPKKPVCCAASSNSVTCSATPGEC